MEVRKIEPLELLACDKLAQVAFEGKRDLSRTAEAHVQQVMAHPETKEQAYAMEKWACFTPEGELMACISALPFQVYFDGGTLPMLGIGGVCTYPHYRRRGAVRSCFHAALQDAYEKGDCFSYLYPFSESFYRSFGYYPSACTIGYTYAMEALDVRKPDGQFHLFTGDAGALEAMAEAYEAYAQAFNLMVKREEHDWYAIKSADPIKGNRYAYWYSDPSGVSRGYLLFHKEQWRQQPVMVVEELVFDSPQTLRYLLFFAKTFQANYRYIRFKAPPTLPLSSVCSDQALYDYERTVQLNGMVRVISIPRVLKSARYEGSGTAVIEVQDAILLGNSKVWRVEFKNGCCTDVSPTEQQADCVMDIGVFSAAITGTLDAADLLWLDPKDVKVLKNTEVLKQVFFHKPCWITDAF